MNGILKAIAVFVSMFAVAGYGDDGKVVSDLCKYMIERQNELAITVQQIEAFRNSEDKAARYSEFYEVLTAAGVPEDVAKSELAKFVSHDKKPTALKKKYDTYVGDVKSQKSECKRIRKILKSGNIPDARIARYLVGFLVATPDDRRQIEKDSPNFIKMYGIVTDFVRETVTEAEDAETIFTDGSFDEEIRDESRRRLKNLEPCSMMGADASWDTYIEKMANGSAVAQMGFEKLKQKGGPCSTSGFSGVLYRHGGMSDSVRVKGVKAAEKLAEQILDLQKANVIDSLKDEEMRANVLRVQWRIARIARMRAVQERQLGQIEQAKRSRAISDELDAYNVSLKRMLAGMEKIREKQLNEFSPKEGLQYALARADFKLARRYAEPILETDPNDPNANFGMGMSYFMQGQFDLAEKHLKRSLRRNAKEPAIWNNLAMVQLRIGRLDEAMKNAKKALEMLPNSADVKDTIKQIEEAVRKKGKCASVVKPK